MLGAEFVGMIMVIVYVGAVAVLFLFVVMMLDIDPLRICEKGRCNYVPIGIGDWGYADAGIDCELVLIYGHVPEVCHRMWKRI